MRVNKIGVLTSGGDAPGMNAAIRAVVRTSLYHSIPVVGIKRGYKGVIENDFVELQARDVGNIIQRGGTMLFTARSEEFKTDKGFEKAVKNLKENNIDSLIVIGGDGSMKGAHLLTKRGINVVGIPATIDNDVSGTEQSLGSDTSLNTITEAVDKLRDTALSHERIFVVEVMGNTSGFLACESAVAVGAESVISPEYKWSIDGIVKRIVRGYEQGKKSHIIIVSEGAASGREVADNVMAKSGMEVRLTVLGHVQRGGTPTTVDRVLGTKFGFEAVNALINGKSGRMVGIIDGKISFTDLEKIKTENIVDDRMHEAVQNILSI
ncbi:MAG: 6-phosphofructokinase [Clostridia bacterium]